MRRSPARFLPTLLTLVTVVLAGFAAAGVQRLIEIDSRSPGAGIAAELRGALAGGSDYEPARAGIEAAAAGLESAALERSAAGKSVIGLGAVFFAGLGLLVLSLIAAERNARNLLRLARQSRVDADRTRAQLVEAVENINEGFVLYDSEDRLVICNRKFREAYKIVADQLKTGVTSEQILRAATERGQFPQAAGKTEEWIANRLEQRRRFDPPFEQQLAGGRWHMVSDRATRDGGLVGIRTDITELKRRELELREARKSLEAQAERMRALAEETQLAKGVLQDAIESINEGFCLFDAEDRLVMCNSRYRDMHTLIRGELEPGARFTDILRAAICAGNLIVGDGIEAAVAERLLARQNLEDSSVEEQFDDDRWVRVSTRRMRNGGMVSVFADITEMKRREFALTSAQVRLERQTREMTGLAEAAQRANRAKSEFLAMMSHEIRTPLNGVISALNLVGNSTAPQDDQRLLSTARTGAHSLLKILNDILDMSKIEAGMLALEPRAFRIQDVIGEVVSLCRVQAEAKGLAFEARVSPEVPDHVSGDADRIRQMVLNYATNAIKFTQSGGVEIHVSMEKGGIARFEVADTGMGIPSSRHGQVFRDFVQLDQSIRRLHGGTGLGLAITRRLARIMNGNVGFTSEPGHGSAFWFEVPLPAAAAPQTEREFAGSPSAAAAGTARVAGPGLRILLAEDNETNRYLAHLMLERMGCAVTDVCDGEQAVEAAARGGWDLVLMDISMPVMDGLEATRRIRAAGSQMPVIALSANTGPDFEGECRDAGMNGCLTKPIDIAALRQRLSAIAGGAREIQPAAGDLFPAGAPALLDAEALERIHRDLGAEAFQRVLAGCRKDIAAEVSAVLEAWNAFPDAGGAQNMRHAAHKLVSLAATIGATELSRLSRMIEAGGFAETDRAAFESAADASVAALIERAERVSSPPDAGEGFESPRIAAAN